jgi:biopolymer transport protein ExbD
MSQVDQKDGLAGINDLPDPKTFSAHTGEGRPKKKRRHEEEHSGHVSLNSLLDILSVILVFLIKSYSASTVQVKPSKDLQVPMSHSAAEVEESLAVTVTLKAVMVDDKPVLMFENGQIPEKMRSSGGFMVDALYATLQDEVTKQQKIAEFNKAAEFKGLITIIADRNVPFSLITQVMYTAGQAQFSKFKFAAIKAERAGSGS